MLRRPHSMDELFVDSGNQAEPVRSQRPGSSLTIPVGREVVIVTTASLPWRTGTAVNPTLRAAYLAKETACKVTLVVPWLTVEEQSIVFPDHLKFSRPEQQEQHVKEWVMERCGFEPAFDICWYPARYDGLFMSILPAGSVIDHIPLSKRDVAILEEPEHLNWFNNSQRWSSEFEHVVGIMHTNYVDYMRRSAGPLGGSVMRMCTSWLTRIHCHKVIKLSDAIQPLDRSVTQFVHGVAKPFLETGEGMALGQGTRLPNSVSSPAESADPATSSNSGDEPAAAAPYSFNKGAYFIGKAVWGKGYTELLDHMAAQKDIDGSARQMDIYGFGEDMDAIKAKAVELGLDMNFLGAEDHMAPSLRGYRVLINPSTSDVVATTSAEALAMGKWLLCARHPENAFFEQFQNALIYSNQVEFAQLLSQAMEQDPPPLTEDDHRRLTWEDATDRLLQAAEISAEEWPTGFRAAKDTALWRFYRPFTGLEALQQVLGHHDGGKDAQEDLERAAGARPDGDSDTEEGDEDHRGAGSRTNGNSGFRMNFLHNSESSGMTFRF